MAAPADSDQTDFDLLVLGDVNPDLVLTGKDLIPAFGQVEQLLDSAALTIGGSGAILACGAARLGLRTAIVGVVGDDLFGRFMTDALTECGVDVSGLVAAPGESTGLTSTGTMSKLGETVTGSRSAKLARAPCAQQRRQEAGVERVPRPTVRRGGRAGVAAA